MRGVTFTLEAVVTLLLLMAFASYASVSIRNVDNLLFYKALAMDVADLASSENFWQMPTWQQEEKVEEWSLKTGLCIALVKSEERVESENCSFLSREHVVTSERAFFENNALKGVSFFAVEVAQPG